MSEVKRIKRKGGDIILVGTAHISKNSVNLVKKTVEKEKPKNVALELCEPRLEVLTKKKKWLDTPITELIKSKKMYFFLAYSLLSAFERRLSEKTGIKPGEEMLQGFKSAKKVNAKVILADRPIAITLGRAWKMMGLREKFRLMYEFIGSLFYAEEISEKELDELKKQDVITGMMKELGRIVPSGKKVLVDERDEYIAGKLMESKGKTVAIVGAGHMRGVEKRIKSGKKVNLKRLEKMPKKRINFGFLKYAIPLFVIAFLAYGVFTNPENAAEITWRWVIVNGVFSALGALLALAHPLAIMAAFIAAPLTSLLPFVGAGWVAGLVEAKLNMPKVKDFEDLRDLTGVRDFWKNRITKILLVAALANLGSVIGTFVALPYIAQLL